MAEIGIKIEEKNIFEPFWLSSKKPQNMLKSETERHFLSVDYKQNGVVTI